MDVLTSLVLILGCIGLSVLTGLAAYALERRAERRRRDDIAREWQRAHRRMAQRTNGEPVDALVIRHLRGDDGRTPW